MSRSRLFCTLSVLVVGMGSSLALASGFAESDRERARFQNMGGMELSLEVSKRTVNATRHCGMVYVRQLKNSLAMSLAEGELVRADGSGSHSVECETAAKELEFAIDESVSRATDAIEGRRRNWHYRTRISVPMISVLPDHGAQTELGSEECLVVARQLVNVRRSSLQRPFPPNVQSSNRDGREHCVFTSLQSLTQLRESRSGAYVLGRCETWVGAGYDVDEDSIKLSSDFLIYEGSPEAVAQMPDFRWFMEVKPGAQTARLTLASTFAAKSCSISQIVSVGASELR